MKHLFNFPTYIVTKLYEEYHEDHLVIENNLNMAGGLFKSPTSSPVNDPKMRLLDRNAALNGGGGGLINPGARGNGFGLGGGPGQPPQFMQPYSKMAMGAMGGMTGGRPRNGINDLAVPAIKISDIDNPKNSGGGGGVGGGGGGRMRNTRDTNLLR